MCGKNAESEDVRRSAPRGRGTRTARFAEERSTCPALGRAAEDLSLHKIRKGGFIRKLARRRARPFHRRPANRALSSGTERLGAKSEDAGRLEASFRPIGIHL